MRIEVRVLASIITNILLPLFCLAQSKNPALDSMGANDVAPFWFILLRVS
jgi:hypothetical protein